MGEIEKRLVRVFESPEGADVVAAYLFGSVAEAREHRESDVDVAVLLDRDRHPSARARFERRLELVGRLQAALGGRDVQVLSLDDLPPPFARRIVTEGRRIACADAERAHAFVRDVQLKAADLEPFLRRMRRLKLDGLAP